MRSLLRPLCATLACVVVSGRLFDGLRPAMSGGGGTAMTAAASGGDARKKWCPLLDVLSVDSNPADGTPISWMIVAHVTYRSSLLVRSLRVWRRRFGTVTEKRRLRLSLAAEWYARRRLFLFFRAWQWRHRERVDDRTNVAAASAHCASVTSRRCLKAWGLWSCARREARTRVADMFADNCRRAMARCWAAWRRVARHSMARRKLRGAVDVWRQRLYFGVWQHVAFQRKTSRLKAAALFLHLPTAWLAMPMSFCKGHFVLWKCDADNDAPDNGGSFVLLAMRFYWISWLGQTARRRAFRLRRYEIALQRIENHRDTRVLARSYHRWLMRVVSTFHSRRTALVICCTYFRKWLLFFERQALCERLRKNVLLGLKSSVLQLWREHTGWAQLCHHRTAQADDFYSTTLQSGLRRVLFDRWIGRVRSRRAYKLLEEETRSRRTELLRDIAVGRLLESVLFTFWQPSGGETCFGERRKPQENTERLSIAAATDASAVLSAFAPAARDSGDVVNSDPAGAFRKRLASRSVAIPLAGRVTHIDAAAQSTSHCSRTCTACADASTLLQPAEMTSALSLHTSAAALRFESSVDVAEGRRLLATYRAMVAAAPAEREEVRILQEKLRLYGVQKQRCVGHSQEIHRAEAQLHQRLLALQQRELDRLAMRAQVTQLAKKLEVVLPLSDPSCRVLRQQT